MSCQENDKIYEAAFEDFYELYSVSDSFSRLVDKLIIAHGDLEGIFHALWENDCELLCSDKRVAVEALIMFNESVRVFRQ